MPVGAARAADHPFRQSRALRLLQRVAEQQPLQRVDHLDRRRRVAFVAGRGVVQFGFPVIEAERRVAARAHERRDGLRAAEHAHQQVAGTLVAGLQHRRAQLLDRHARVDVAFRDRRARNDFIATVQDAARQQRRVERAAREYRGRRGDRVRAAKREALARMVRDAHAVRRIERGDAEPAIRGLLERGQLSLGGVGAPLVGDRRGRARGDERRGNGGKQQRAACRRVFHECRGFCRNRWHEAARARSEAAHPITPTAGPRRHSPRFPERRPSAPRSAGLA